MKCRASGLIVTIAMVFLLSIQLTGCGGAKLDYGQTRNIESAEPNFMDPMWWEEQYEDPEATAKKYKDKIFEVEVLISDFDEVAGGIEVRGATGQNDSYRITCLFTQTAGSRIQSLSPNSRITVKGLFSRIEDVSNTYHLYLTSCILQR